MTIFLQDDCTGSGPLQAHAVSGPGATGGAWAKHPAATSDATLTANGTLDASAIALYTNAADPGADDYSVLTTFALGEGICGPRVRQDVSVNTGYEAVFYLTAQQLLLIRWNAGTPTTLETLNGHTTCSSLRLEVSGVGATVNLKMYKDGNATAINGSGAGYNDTSASRITARGKAGLREYQVSSGNHGITAITGESAGAAGAALEGAASATASATGDLTTSGGAAALQGAAGATAAAAGTLTAGIRTAAMKNISGDLLASTAVHWTWFPAGRVGSMEGVSQADGTGTTDGGGQLFVTDLQRPGILMVASRQADAATDLVYYEAFL